MSKTARFILSVWMFVVWIIIEAIIAKVWSATLWWVVWSTRLVSACCISGLVTLVNEKKA